MLDFIVGRLSPEAHEELEVSHLNMLHAQALHNIDEKRQSVCSINPINCEGTMIKGGRFNHI